MKTNIVYLFTWNWLFPSEFSVFKLLTQEFSCCKFLSHVQLCNRMDSSRLPCPSLSPRVCSNSCPSSQWCHPTILSSVTPFSSCPQSLNIRVSSSKSALHIRWPKDWSFSFSISLSNEYSGLLYFRIDWFDLRDTQGTQKYHCAYLLHSYYLLKLKDNCIVFLPTSLALNSMMLLDSWAFPMVVVVKNPSANTGDTRDAGSV